MVLRYDLATGTPIVPSALQVKRAVRGGTSVRLVARSDRFEISAPGIALADGDIGDRIQVRRIADGRTTQARISAADEAVVEP
jgi:flagella basal body P-ring formation protein FlgA